MRDNLSVGLLRVCRGCIFLNDSFSRVLEGAEPLAQGVGGPSRGTENNYDVVVVLRSYSVIGLRMCYCHKVATCC